MKGLEELLPLDQEVTIRMGLLGNIRETQGSAVRTLADLCVMLLSVTSEKIFGRSAI